MQVRLRGVRGSVPYSTPESMRHGCNTTCVDVLDAQTGKRLIIDAGSGIVGLGDTLGGHRDISILLTHYHWDHIQGLPSFAPLFSADHRVTLWTPNLEGAGADVQTLFQKPFFPVAFEELKSRPQIEVVNVGEVVIAGFHVRVQPLKHPGGAFAYRVRGAVRDLVCATDHEFGDAAFDDPLAAFVSGAGTIILDAHYTPDEMHHFAGWGHSDWRQCARFAARCGVERLLLAHHKPGRTDEELDRIERDARRLFPRTSAACEGDTLTL